MVFGVASWDNCMPKAPLNRAAMVSTFVVASTMARFPRAVLRRAFACSCKRTSRSKSAVESCGGGGRKSIAFGRSLAFRYVFAFGVFCADRFGHKRQATSIRMSRVQRLFMSFISIMISQNYSFFSGV